ncbi:hypothetical protein IFT48_00245 [Pseudomonas fluorescens]|uniref:hypothetical protein n=1 Tax=Pseudomonas TaxID=286 RepID=UPI000F028F8B|nr:MULTISPECIES: hypothetical protein [Pseudomonas]MBD8088422.1 hypothetical protein [Pseudomonas fluorescens]MBD8615132.1 hypothetical protein [Pseudomonas putida]MBD8681193.1 hypothetical protein [Pseudomonas sp. CFBP 13719]
MSFLKNLGKSITASAKRFAPASLTPEKRFARALVTSSALITMADGSAEESEIEQASQIISGHNSIKQYLTPAEAHDMYAEIIEELVTAYKNPTSRLMEVNKRVAEIGDTVKEASWRREIIEFANVMASSNSRGRAGADEQAIIDKIKTILA